MLFIIILQYLISGFLQLIWIKNNLTRKLLIKFNQIEEMIIFLPWTICCVCHPKRRKDAANPVASNIRCSRPKCRVSTLPRRLGLFLPNWRLSLVALILSYNAPIHWWALGMNYHSDKARRNLHVSLHHLSHYLKYDIYLWNDKYN